jgi:hypothetical protein
MILLLLIELSMSIELVLSGDHVVLRRYSILFERGRRVAPLVPLKDSNDRFSVCFFFRDPAIFSQDLTTVGGPVNPRGRPPNLLALARTCALAASPDRGNKVPETWPPRKREREEARMLAEKTQAGRNSLPVKIFQESWMASTAGQRHPLSSVLATVPFPSERGARETETVRIRSTRGAERHGEGYAPA